MDRSTVQKIEKPVPKIGITAHFTHRDRMMRTSPANSFRAPGSVPATTLPVDSIGQTHPQFLMDGNDSLGDCGFAMMDHVDVIYKWRQGQGKQYTVNLKALENQYLQVSGGDNGVDESMLVGPGGCWMSGGSGIADDSTCVVDDYLDIDVTNIPLAQYAIDQFYTIQMAWSVPDDFLENFTPGSVWLTAARPDPNNGHYTPLASVSSQGYYTLITWGATCTTGPAFISSVQPQSFVVFSRQQFDSTTGLDSKGRHVSVQGAKWVAMGGNPSIVAKVVALFPALPAPTPAPVPPPLPPTPPSPPTPTPGPSPTPVVLQTGTTYIMPTSGSITITTPVSRH